MKKSLLSLVAISTALVSAEPSAFKNQQKISKSEITALKTRDQTIQQNIGGIKEQLAAIGQIQDGIKTVVESQNTINHKTQGQIQKLQADVSKIQSDISTLKEKTSELDSKLKEVINTVNTQQDRIEKLQQALKDLNELTAQNNANIIRQLDLISEALSKRQLVPSGATPTAPKSPTPPKKEEPSPIDKTKSNKELYVTGKDFMNKRNYEDAEKVFSYLIKNNYKTPDVYFMLGEISYRKKSYADAIEYYKQSALLNDKSSYMPILLWRTAWSFKQQGDDTNYNRFIDNLIDTYPNSEQGKKALQEKKAGKKSQVSQKGEKKTDENNPKQASKN